MKNLYEIKHDSYPFAGVWADVMGQPSTNGAWIIWEPEKNGKTWFALMLANYFSGFEKVLYVSAEEGVDKDFTAACHRAGLSHDNPKINIVPYEPLPELRERLKKRRSARVIFVDNLTIYNDELKNGQARKFITDHPDCLIVFLAHEERGEPYTATAKLIRKLAKVIVHVQGLACTVSGRCPGGRLVIDEEKAALYHGQQNTA